MDGSAGSGDGLSVYGTGATWQGIGEMSGPGIIQKILTLVEGVGNFPVPLHLLRSDRLDASVGSIVGELVRGAARTQAQAQINVFWKNSIENEIGKFVADGTALTQTTQAVTLTGGRIRAFRPGLMIDLYIDSGGSPDASAVNQQQSVVNRVDYLQKVIYIRHVATGGSDALADGTTYHIVPDGTSISATTNVVPSGLVDIIKASGTVFNINLTQYPQFRSIVVTNESGALTSDKLNKYIGGFVDAYGAELDTIVTTSGTLLAFLENLDSTSQLLRYESQTKALAIKAGFMPLGYCFNGKDYRIMVSPNCPSGTVYILKLRSNNFRKYVPPRLPAAQSDGRFAGEVEFVSPAMGFSSIFQPLLSSSAVVDQVQAPYLNWMEFCPKMIQGIKLGTFDENIYTG
jgi:hypothetical protein